MSTSLSKKPLPVLLCLLTIPALASCQNSTSVPLANGVAQINATAPPICGRGGAQRQAVKQAAIHTLRNGYDRFVVAESDHYFDKTIIEGSTRVVTENAVIAASNGSAGASAAGSKTTIVKSPPIVSGMHEQTLVIKMFRTGDPGYNTGVSARQVLGSDWQNLIKRDNRSCL